MTFIYNVDKFSFCLFSKKKLARTFFGGAESSGRPPDVQLKNGLTQKFTTRQERVPHGKLSIFMFVLSENHFQQFLSGIAHYSDINEPIDFCKLFSISNLYYKDRLYNKVVTIVRSNNGIYFWEKGAILSISQST